MAVAAADGLVITVGSAVASSSYASITRSWDVDLNASFGVSILCSLLYITSNWVMGLYALPALLYPMKQLSRIVTVCAAVLLGLTAILFLLRIGSDLPRGPLLGFAAAMLVLCCLARLCVAPCIEAMLRRNAIVGRSAYLIGEADELEALTPAYLIRHFGLREAGRTVVTPSAAREAADLRHPVQDALLQARARRAKEFVVATKWDRVDQLLHIESALRLSPLPVRLLPHKELRSIIGRHAPPANAVRYVVDLQRAPMWPHEKVVKRALDIAGAALGIVVLLPVFVLAALAIRVDSAGPIVFRQRRNGFDQKQFVIFKFRTMRVLEDGAAVTQAKRNDQRITRIGRLLRRSSIDELPQLFNVLRGEMSLVGPRPHALAHDQQYTVMIDDYCMRHHVKPGITGWAQVNGCRGETARPGDMERRVKFDVWYIQNWSLILDAQIILRTVLGVFSHDA